METPFKNDPFCMVWMAYKRLYDKPCEVYWDCREKDDETAGFGFTLFPDDGEIPTVIIYADYPVSIQVEILAHELAHVAVGSGHEHDSAWEEAFEAINVEFNKIGDEMFGGAEDGK